MKGNFHVRFLEELEGAISPSYSAGGRKSSPLLYSGARACSRAGRSRSEVEARSAAER